ncbi:MAG: WD40/YVTN/BNR-like repeat-containing protein [Stenotrophobium sp.]
MMRKNHKKWLAALSAAAVLTVTGLVWADSGSDAAAPAGGGDASAAAPAGADASASAPASGGDASASAPASGDAATPPAPPVKPQRSEMEPLTASSLILSVANDGDHLVAVGARGAVIVSNNGKDWAQVQTPVRATLTSVYFVDDKNGWAVGHDATILHTTDGGKTWQLQNFHPELEKPFLQVLFNDANNGIAVGAYGLIEKTNDAGQTWTAVDAPSILADGLHLNSITKLGNGSLLIAGEQGLLGLSADGGATWEKLPPTYDGSLFGALPVGQSGALIYGLRGNVFMTQDVKSNKWTKIDTGTVSSFFGGTILPDGQMVLVGLAGTIIEINSVTGTVKPITITKPVMDNGKEKQEVVTSTLSSVIPFGNGILVTGALGVQTLAQLQ